MWEWSKDVSPVNRFIFPAPKPSSYTKDSLGHELLFIPPKEKLFHYYKHFKKVERRRKEKEAEFRNRAKSKSLSNLKNHKLSRNNTSTRYSMTSSNSKSRNRNSHFHNNTKNKRRKTIKYACENAIPCLYIDRKFPQQPATHLLLYFHGNAEDLGKTYPILDYVRMKLTVNVLCPEYPGYGISNGSACESSVTDLVQHIYEFVISPYGLNVPPNRIIVYGFSIGSAAALSLTNFSLNKVSIPLANHIDRNHNKNENKPATLNHPYFFSTFLKKCPHKYIDQSWLFPSDHFFQEEDLNTYDDVTIDPFSKLPLASLLNILRKGNVSYPKSVAKKQLLQLARKNDLIPAIASCQKANLERKYALLVIVCPFASITQVVADKVGTFASYLLSERFDNTQRIPHVHGPLLIIHGKDDTIIPWQHSNRLNEIAQHHQIRSCLEILEGCDHNTMDLRRITSCINRFFEHQFALCRSQRRLHEEQQNFKHFHVEKQRREMQSKRWRNGHSNSETNLKMSDRNRNKIARQQTPKMPFCNYLNSQKQAKSHQILSTIESGSSSTSNKEYDEEGKQANDFVSYQSLTDSYNGSSMSSRKLREPFVITIPKYCYLRPRHDHPNTELDAVDAERLLEEKKKSEKSEQSNNSETSTDSNEYAFKQLMTLFDMVENAEYHRYKKINSNSNLSSNTNTNTNTNTTDTDSNSNPNNKTKPGFDQSSQSVPYATVNGTTRYMNVRQLNKVHKFFGSVDDNNVGSLSFGEISVSGSSSSVKTNQEHDILIPNDSSTRASIM